MGAADLTAKRASIGRFGLMPYNMSSARGFQPARFASGIEPMVALRYD
jgi:hypothetical protein